MVSTTVSLTLLWIAVLALGILVLALARQVGILFERIAPMGALVIDRGPKVGEPAPVVQANSLDGRTLNIGAPSDKSRLLFFVSPSCPVCKKLLPILKRIAPRESNWLQIVLASDGDREAHAAFRQREALQDFDYVLSAELGMRLQVGKLPYAVLLDAAGVVRAKGLVNSREQIESLFTAQEFGVASIQEHIERESSRATAANGAA